MLLIRELKFVSEERKLKPDFLSVCCCGARVQADGLARVSIMNLIIRTIYARPTRAGRNRHAVFLESDSVNPGKACRTRATGNPRARIYPQLHEHVGPDVACPRLRENPLLLVG